MLFATDDMGQPASSISGRTAKAPRTNGTWGRKAGRRWTCVEIAVCLTLVILCLHSALYWFLTDDAFISFRYARNLSHGYGLVFNPGHERVEGYTNFLWVVLLAGIDDLGVAPEVSANILSMTCTLALWGLVVWFTYRTWPASGPRWLLPTAPLLLGATRSVAVWSTSGLETRLFELLVVGATLRLLVEVEARLIGRARRPMAALLFALASLTRPDGLLISLAALCLAGVYLLLRRRFDWRSFTAQVGLFALVVGGHWVFRLAYYGEWFPNTYYAKLGGRTWWDMGWAYAGLCALEYAAFLWVPLLVAGTLAYRRDGRSFLPLLFAAVVLPHALYVIAIGGDHFEYRPLDLYFPFLFIVMGAGAAYLARRAKLAPVVGCYLLLVLAGLIALPLRSHLEFPKYYLAGFPGQKQDMQASADFLRVENEPLGKVPGVSYLAGAYRHLLFKTTAQLAAIRQEEHRLCLEQLATDGRRLGELVEGGRLTRAAYLAMVPVGAVPYYSDLRILDRLGLTDAYVAHSAPAPGQRVMAHDKRATFEYAQQRGVDFWAVPLSPLLPLSHPMWLQILGVMGQTSPEYPICVADVGAETYLVVLLPQGLQPTQARWPKLTFEPLSRPDVAARVVEGVTSAYRRQVSENPQDARRRCMFAEVLLNSGHELEAIEQYRQALPHRPDDPRAWQNLATAYANLQRWGEAVEATERALAAAERQEDQPLVAELDRALQTYRQASRMAR